LNSIVVSLDAKMDYHIIEIYTFPLFMIECTGFMIFVYLVGCALVRPISNIQLKNYIVSKLFVEQINNVG